MKSMTLEDILDDTKALIGKISNLFFTFQRNN